MSSQTLTRSIPFGRPLLTQCEKDAVLAVLDGPTLTHGPVVREFERAFAAFTGAPYAVATSSCTAAMHLAYLHLGIGPGDEVIVPAQTHVATAHAVAYCGATPVFVDSESATGNMDIDRLAGLITDRTKAIAVVHYLGLPVDMGRIVACARKHGLFVVEDCALAIGARFDDVHVGLHGDCGCFSFYPVKHITTAEGGMLITRHKDMADSVAQLRAFGIDRNIVSTRRRPGQYDVTALGFNYRLNEIGAAIGLAQMEQLPDFLTRRAENHGALTTALREIDEIEIFTQRPEGARSSHYCHAILLGDALQDQRDSIVETLTAEGVGTSVYYPKPVPETSYYQHRKGESAGQFPVASAISSSSIALPVGPHLELDDIDFMVQRIKDAVYQATHHG